MILYRWNQHAVWCKASEGHMRRVPVSPGRPRMVLYLWQWTAPSELDAHDIHSPSKCELAVTTASPWLPFFHTAEFVQLDSKHQLMMPRNNPMSWKTVAAILKERKTIFIRHKQTQFGWRDKHLRFFNGSWVQWRTLSKTFLDLLYASSEQYIGFCVRWRTRKEDSSVASGWKTYLQTSF